MKNHLTHGLSRIVIAGAFALLAFSGATAVAAAPQKAVTSDADKYVGITVTDAAKKVDPAAVDTFIKTVSPQAQAAMGRLSADERAQVFLDSSSSLAQATASSRFKSLMSTLSIVQQVEQYSALRSEYTFLNADAKYNYCNYLISKESEIIYDENGLKKLTSTALQCPVNVPVSKTIAYVNKVLACSVGDPAYTRIMPPEEASDMQQEMAGTKTAFAGGGIGMILSVDQTRTLPLTPEQAKSFAAAKAAYLANPVQNGDADECTGAVTPLTDKEKAEIAKYWSTEPHNYAFDGLIEHVMKDSPAAAAGIVDGDRIVKVDGQDVRSLEANSVVSNLLRGPVGSKVKIVLERDPSKEYVLTRKAILSDNVWSRDLGDGIYSIVITNFERNNTGFEVLDEMQKIGSKAKGIIFDVRNNGGGLMDEGVEAASWLIHDGVIFSQRERVAGDPTNPQYLKITWSRVGSKLIRETVDDNTQKLLEGGPLTVSEDDNVTGEVHRQFTDMPFLGDKPMVVLVNGHCASACEIFAGAVGENHIAQGDNNKAPQGAEIIGEQTYGKFIGQTLQPGPMGTEVKATTFRYFSPRGEWLGDAWKTKIGLTPDIKVAQPENAQDYTSSDAQLNFAKQYLLSGGTAKP